MHVKVLQKNQEQWQKDQKGLKCQSKSLTPSLCGCWFPNADNLSWINCVHIGNSSWIKCVHIGNSSWTKWLHAGNLSWINCLSKSYLDNLLRMNCLHEGFYPSPEWTFFTQTQWIHSGQNELSVDRQLVLNCLHTDNSSWTVCKQATHPRQTVCDETNHLELSAGK